MLAGLSWKTFIQNGAVKNQSCVKSTYHDAFVYMAGAFYVTADLVIA